MSRLIDAVDLLSYIDRIKNRSGLGKQKSLEYITKYITNMPTAYDVDKVVEHIEKSNRIIEESMKAPIDEVQTFMYKIQLYTANNIIDVIKGGKIDGKKRS